MTFRQTAATAATAAALALGVLGLPAVAQGQAPVQAPAEAPGAAYSGAVLDAFVTAFLEVNAVRGSYIDRLQQAEDDATQQALVEEGNSAITAAIEGVEGMDVALYAAILDAAAVDETLNTRIQRRLQDAAG